MLELTVPWWELILRSVVVYGFLLLLLRMTGKRQIGQLSPLDLVLLLILSNAVQNSMNGGDQSLIGGLISAATLITLNYLIGFITFRSRKVEDVVEGRPQILVRDSKVIQSVMADSKLTQEELGTALREVGYFSVEDVKLAILETNGSISVQGYEKKQSQPRKKKLPRA